MQHMIMCKARRTSSLVLKLNIHLTIPDMQLPNYVQEASYYKRLRGRLS